MHKYADVELEQSYVLLRLANLVVICLLAYNPYYILYTVGNHSLLVRLNALLY